MLGRFELAGLAAEDIDEVLELVEEVESESSDEVVLEAPDRPGAGGRGDV